MILLRNPNFKIEGWVMSAEAQAMQAIAQEFLRPKA
jgi:hypothetical protein